MHGTQHLERALRIGDRRANSAASPGPPSCSLRGAAFVVALPVVLDGAIPITTSATAPARAS
jgi:hypothetical protein